MKISNPRCQSGCDLRGKGVLGMCLMSISHAMLQFVLAVYNGQLIVVGACVEEFKRCDVVCGVTFLDCLTRG